MNKWEYRSMFMGSNIPTHERDQYMTEWGQGGWETTGIVEESPGGQNYLMKRSSGGAEERAAMTKGKVKHDHSVVRKCGAFCEMRGTLYEITEDA